MYNPLSKFYRRQAAFRRLLLDGEGQLTKDGRILVNWLAEQCYTKSTVLRYKTDLTLDPTATVAAAARRDVWDRFRRILDLDHYQETNLSEDDR